MSQNLTNTGKRFDLPAPDATTSLDAQETKSLRCAAAGITAPSSSTTEVLIPHEKLREAASPNATLTAQTGSLAQLVEGYKHPHFIFENPPDVTVNEVQIDERAEFEKEFPVPESLQYCTQRGTSISAPGAKTCDSFAREHYAYRAGFAAWKRRAWKHPQLIRRQVEDV